MEEDDRGAASAAAAAATTVSNSTDRTTPTPANSNDTSTETPPPNNNNTNNNNSNNTNEPTPPPSSTNDNGSGARLSLWQTEPHKPPKIFHAIWNHQWDYARYLLSSPSTSSSSDKDTCTLSNTTISASLSHTDSYGYTPLHFACWEGAPPSLLNEMLSKYAVAASRRNNKGRTPLHFACWRGTDECVIRLLKHRPDAASVRDKNDKSPLYDACTRNRSYDVLRALLLADIKQSSVKSKWGYSAATVLAKITHACAVRSLRCTELLFGVLPLDQTDKQEEEEEDDDKEEKEYRIWDIISRVSLLLHSELHCSFPLPPPPLPNKTIPPLSIDTALRSPSCPHVLLLVALEYDRRYKSVLSQLQISSGEDVVVLNCAATTSTTTTKKEETKSHSKCGRKKGTIHHHHHHPKGSSSSSSASSSSTGDYLLHTAAKLTYNDFPYELFYRCDKCGFTPPRHYAHSLLSTEKEEEKRRSIYFNKDPYMSHYGVSCSKCMVEALRSQYLKVEPVDKIAKAVSLLVQSFPSAASFPDSNGRLPISLYIESGKHWDAGLDLLFRASTRTIETRDVCTHMYPFMMAAAGDVGVRRREEEEDRRGGAGGGGEEGKEHGGIVMMKKQQRHLSNNNNHNIKLGGGGGGGGNDRHWRLNLRQKHGNHKSGGGGGGEGQQRCDLAEEELQDHSSSSSSSSAPSLQPCEWKRKSTIVFNLLLKDPCLLKLGLLE